MSHRAKAITARVPLLMLLLAAPVAAEDSMVISGLTLTLGSPRADVERAIQARFRVELALNGSWALWERATDRAASVPGAGDQAQPRQTVWEHYNVTPPAELPPPKHGF